MKLNKKLKGHLYRADLTNFIYKYVLKLNNLVLCFFYCRRNVGWASTCNTVGQTAGFFLGNVVFLALESADFCNNYLRSEAKTSGMVTLSGEKKNMQLYAA